MGEWQPIETAPKDGTTILVYSPRGIITSAWWSAAWNAFVEWNSGGTQNLSPTHWQPLPETPKD